VDPGKCSDQAASSTEGRWWTRGGESLWEFHWWSYQACEEFLSEAPTTVGGNIDQHCWCESDQAPLTDIRFHQHQPLCGVGEWMVCHGGEEEEEEDVDTVEEVETAPAITKDPVCSCNGELNDFGVQACGSFFFGTAWCYVEPGRCTDEITNGRTGKSWSKSACEARGDRWEWT